MLFVSDPTLLGVAAIITAISGIVSAVWGFFKSRREGREQADQELRDHLRECREEAEALATELHAMKMRRFDRES